MARFRTLNQTYDYVKEQDNETALTANCLRRMVIIGAIPSIKAGKKYLIDIDTLFKHLENLNPEDVLEGYKSPVNTNFESINKFK